MYMGDDPEAPNYDKQHKLCRSLFTGSRGPMLRKATGLDWAGDQLVLPVRSKPATPFGRGGGRTGSLRLPPEAGAAPH